MVKKTHGEFVEDLKSKVGDDFVVIGKYEGVKIPIEVKHICGYKIIKTPDKLLHKKLYCPKCDGTPERWNHEKYKRFVCNEGKGEYELLSEYKGMGKPILIKHIPCGNVHESSARLFKEGVRCQKCVNRIAHNKLSHEEFLMRLPAEQSESYQVISQLNTTHDPITIKCLKCGSINNPFPSNLLKGHGACNNCSYINAVLTKRDKYSKIFLEKVKSENEYILLSSYVNSTTDVKFKHTECGKEYTQKPANFIQGSRCPVCASSKGEKKIQHTLSKLALSFEREFSFNDLKYKNKLRFDFAIFDKNNHVKMLVEFDGKHHFEDIEYFKSSLKEVKKRDDLKNKYCEENGIKLLRIPYYEIENIEEIITNEVSRF